MWKGAPCVREIFIDYGTLCRDWWYGPTPTRQPNSSDECSRELRQIGRPMQQIDIMVAAIAFSLGTCIVVTSDTDLAEAPGLAVENWAVVS